MIMLSSLIFSFLAVGSESAVYDCIWPIFMFTIISSFSQIGMITTTVLLLSLVVFYIVGKLTDKVGRHRVLRWGTIFYALSWFLKIFATSPWRLFAFDAYQKLAIGPAFIPWKTIVYDKASSHGDFRDEFIIFRTIIMNLARFAVLAGFGVVFIFFPVLPIAFVFAGLVALGFLLI